MAAYIRQSLKQDSLFMLAHGIRLDTPSHPPWDSKHNVEVESGKTARLLFSLREMRDGETRF